MAEKPKEFAAAGNRVYLPIADQPEFGHLWLRAPTEEVGPSAVPARGGGGPRACPALIRRTPPSPTGGQAPRNPGW